MEDNRHSTESLRRFQRHVEPNLAKSTASRQQLDPRLVLHLQKCECRIFDERRDTIFDNVPIQNDLFSKYFQEKDKDILTKILNSENIEGEEIIKNTYKKDCLFKSMENVGAKDNIKKEIRIKRKDD